MSSSLPSYVRHLRDFARARSLPTGALGCEEQLSRMAPELTGRFDLEPSNPARALLRSLLGLLAQELQEISTQRGTLFSAVPHPHGALYDLDGCQLFASNRTLIELWRFGIALALPKLDQAQFEQTLHRWWLKEVQGAMRVAKRRHRTFHRVGGLHRAGATYQIEARKVEAAMALMLSDGERSATRSDLASDWLDGVDLWLHRPGAAPHKGHKLALSLAMSSVVQNTKSQAQGPGLTLWTPSSLVSSLFSDLDAKGECGEVAQAAWRSLGAPVNPQDAARALRRALVGMSHCSRGKHPGQDAPPGLFSWIRMKRPGKAF